MVGPVAEFDTRAKLVLALAQDEALRFHHNYIGPEHVLIGLVREHEGIAARVLKSIGLKVPYARWQVERIIGRGESSDLAEIPLQPRALILMELAVDEAEKRGDARVGTEHLLLGYIREIERDGAIVDVLGPMNITTESLRQKTIEGMGPVA